MVDMIDHENLPNSVGTFKKLKEILIDVRTTLNNLLHWNVWKKQLKLLIKLDDFNCLIFLYIFIIIICI